MAPAACSVDWLEARRRTSVTSSLEQAWVKAPASVNFSVMMLGGTELNICDIVAIEPKYFYIFRLVTLQKSGSMA